MTLAYKLFIVSETDCLLLTLSSCFEANLNGEYFSDPTDNGYYRGIIWELWLGDYSLKETKMMIRPGGPNGDSLTERPSSWPKVRDSLGGQT